MANDTNFWGLRPVKHYSGSPWNGVTEKCYVGATYGTAMYIGDNVMINNLSADSDATALYTSVERAALTAASLQYGVIVSFDEIDGVDHKKVYNPASTERYINVCVDPTVIYHIRDDGSGTPGRTWPFLNATMVAGTSSTITGLSGIGLDATTPAVDQTAPLLIIRLANLPNNALGDYAIWEVMLNTHQLMGGAAGQVLGVAKA